MTPELAVVIVSFNTRDHLRACLATVARRAPVVVADNGSSDGSVEMVRREFPSVVLDIDRSNPGYGAGANRGIRRCGSADVLLLNSDTRVRTGTLAALTAYLRTHPQAGIVAPRLVNQDGTLQRSCFPFPSPLRPLFRADPFARLVRHVPVLRERYLPTWSHDGPRMVPWVMGAALVIRRAAFDAVGGFDESFFMYAEEIDLCYRLARCGWEVHYTPAGVVTHVGAASTGQQRVEMLAQSCASARRFYQRHFSGMALFRAECTMRTAMCVRLLRDRLRYAIGQDDARRFELMQNISVWRHALSERRMTRA